MSTVAKLMRFVLRRSRGRFWLALAVGLVSGLATAGQVAVINAAIDGRHSRDLMTLGAWFIALLVVAPTTRELSQHLLVQLGQNGLSELRLELGRHVLRTPLPRLEELGAHRLTAALTEDIATMTQSVVAIPEIATSAALVLGSMAYLGWLSWRLLAVFLVLFVPALAAYRFPLAVAFGKFRKVREEQDALHRHIRGLTDGTKELKLHRDRRDGFMASLARTTEGLRDLYVRASLILGSAISGAWAFFFVALGVVIFVAPRIWAVPPAALTGFALVLLFVRGPLQAVVSSLPVVARGGVAIESIERLGLMLESQGLEREAPTGAPRPSWRRLELDGVSHVFRRDDSDEEFVLGPIDLVFRPGELVFLVGGNGSGKTSLAKLLLGLYPAESGAIRLDGEAVTRDDLDRYRQNFTAVFFDFYLFDDLFGVGGQDADRQARHLLDLLRIGHKLEVKDGRLSTTALSQGQRKRLALLTAYLEDRPIYLFDEWAADQDPYFKEVFYRQLLPQLKARGKTVLVISHDDRYYGLADRIVKLSEGRVVYDGPPGGALAAEPLAWAAAAPSAPHVPSPV